MLIFYGGTWWYVGWGKYGERGSGETGRENLGMGKYGEKERGEEVGKGASYG